MESHERTNADLQIGNLYHLAQEAVRFRALCVTNYCDLEYVPEDDWDILPPVIPASEERLRTLAIQITLPEAALAASELLRAIEERSTSIRNAWVSQERTNELYDLKALRDSGVSLTVDHTERVLSVGPVDRKYWTEYERSLANFGAALVEPYKSVFYLSQLLAQGKFLGSEDRVSAAEVDRLMDASYLRDRIFPDVVWYLRTIDSHSDILKPIALLCDKDAKISPRLIAEMNAAIATRLNELGLSPGLPWPDGPMTVQDLDPEVQRRILKAVPAEQVVIQDNEKIEIPVRRGRPSLLAKGQDKLSTVEKATLDAYRIVGKALEINPKFGSIKLIEHFKNDSRLKDCLNKADLRYGEKFFHAAKGWWNSNKDDMAETDVPSEESREKSGEPTVDGR